MSTGIEIRPLRSDDATALSDAFASMNKQAELFDRYAAEEQAGHRACWVATVHGEYAGYVTLVWEATYPGIAGKKIPDIQDLNVVPYLRRCFAARSSRC
jgi:hypothetical protein